MSEIKLDIPNIVVLVNNDLDYRKVIVKPDSNFNVTVNLPTLISQVSGSFIQFAETALTSSFVITASYANIAETEWTRIDNIPSGIVSSSTQVNYNLLQNLPTTIPTASYVLNAVSASYAKSASYGVTSSYAVTASYGLSSSFATTASAASTITFTSFSNNSFYFPQNVRVDGTLTVQELNTEYVTSSIIYESGSTKFGDSADDTHQITGSLLIRGSTSGSSFTGSFKGDGSQLTGIVAQGTVSSSVQINTGSFSGSFAGFLLGTSSWAESSSNAISASYAVTSSYLIGGGAGAGFPYSGSGVITGSLLISSSGLTLVGRGVTGSLLGTSSYALLASQSRFADTASYIDGGISIENGLNITGSVIITGSLIVSGSITGSLLGTASNAISSSFAITASNAITSSFSNTASFALNAGAGSGFPYSGSAVITGSLLITGSGLRVTGSTDILGNFTATTKSFLIDHQRLEGKKLVYGVLEGPEHAVFVRGKLDGTNTITLPDEWEWLVDDTTITVHITPINKHQALFVKEITPQHIVVENGTNVMESVECYYIIHAERKDVTNLITVV